MSRERKLLNELISITYDPMQAHCAGTRLADYKGVLKEFAELAEPTTEPIAWLYDFTIEGETITDWTTTDIDVINNPENGYHNIRPLYLSPQQYKPLSDDDIKKIYSETSNSGWAMKFARAIEKAITKQEQS